MKLDLDALPHMTNNKVAKALEAAMEEWHAASMGIFVLALHGHERFREIMERIGAEHAAAIRFSTIDNVRAQIEAEARMRVGPTASTAGCAYALERSGRYVRCPRKKAA